MKQSGTYKRERVMTSPQNAEIFVQGSFTPVLNFCANNYLGLAAHPEVSIFASKILTYTGIPTAVFRY